MKTTRQSISFEIDDDDLAAVDTYAANLEQNRDYVLNQAVKMWLLTARREEAELAEAEAAVERGEGVPMEEVFRRFEVRNHERE